MIMKISLAVAVLLSSAVLAQYQKAPIPFNDQLKCTACIRGGWNYCVTINGTQANNTIVTQGCEAYDRNPNAYINTTNPGP